MWVAYSRLKFLLDERGLSGAELARRIAADERPSNVKSLYRLCDPDIPLEGIDLRLAGAICRVLEIDLAGLIVFAQPELPLLSALDSDKQRRLDELMESHSEGRIGQEDLEERRALRRDVERRAGGRGEYCHTPYDLASIMIARLRPNRRRLLDQHASFRGQILWRADARLLCGEG